MDEKGEEYSEKLLRQKKYRRRKERYKAQANIKFARCTKEDVSMYQLLRKSIGNILHMSI